MSNMHIDDIRLILRMRKKLWQITFAMSLTTIALCAASFALGRVLLP